MVPEKCDVGSTEWCRVDVSKKDRISLILAMVIIVEVDEHQHSVHMYAKRQDV
jgi:hypothetical protein